MIYIYYNLNSLIREFKADEFHELLVTICHVQFTVFLNHKLIYNYNECIINVIITLYLTTWNLASAIYNVITKKIWVIIIVIIKIKNTQNTQLKII